MKYKNQYISLLVLLTISCQSKLPLKNWEGIGVGDSYLRIQDSIFSFNGPDHFISNLKIEAIRNDTIYSRYYDFDTGELGRQFLCRFDNSHGRIYVQLDTILIHFTSIKRTHLLHNNKIESVQYKIFDYEGGLTKQYQLNSNGEISISGATAKQVTQIKNLKGVERIVNKLSILDLDNFVWSEPNFFMISHAPCHCLEIEYNEIKKIRYCRQKHNSYLNAILSEIKNL